MALATGSGEPILAVGNVGKGCSAGAGFTGRGGCGRRWRRGSERGCGSRMGLSLSLPRLGACDGCLPQTRPITLGMAEPHQVVLNSATSADAELLSNLLELYIHDLSAAFPDVELGADGRFGYLPLALYWSQPERRFAFLIRCDDRIAGFALVTRGSPATDDPDVFDVAEFFVLRRYRRAGVGRQAAERLWKRLPGRWIVRVFEGNSGAVPFWSRVIEGFTGKAATVIERPGHPTGWRVFSFEGACPPK
jgi:predicted acetyltransferase